MRLEGLVHISEGTSLHRSMFVDGTYPFPEARVTILVSHRQRSGARSYIKCVVLLHGGSDNKIAQVGWKVNSTHLFVSVPETAGPASERRKAQCPVRTTFCFLDAIFSACPHMVAGARGLTEASGP